MTADRGDICVVGGGVIGLAIAFELAERGRHVTVLERGRIGERAAAGVAAGMLAPVFEADHLDPELTPLALESRASYGAWVRRVEAAAGMRVGYDATGALIVALHRDHQARIDHLGAFMRERGLVAEPVGRAELRELEPVLAPSAIGGLRAADDHQVDPRRLLAALRAALERASATVLEETRVTAVSPAAGRAEVTFERQGRAATIGAEQVVLAAGAWTSELACAADLPLRPVRGLILRLRGEPLIRHVVRTPDVYLVPRGDGELVVGATMEERGFDDRAPAGDVHDLLREATRVVPAVRDLALTECAVGFRPALRDHRPAIGATRDPAVFVATGHYRNGVLLAPLTAALLADEMLEGRRDARLDAFRADRFAAVVAS